jgi:uncharacterized membrane protein
MAVRGDRRRPVRISALLGAAVLLAGLAAAQPAPAAAQVGLSITTPFPSVSVQPGANATFDLTIAADEPVRVALGVEGVPDGWRASFTGGGNEVHAVYVEPGRAAEVSLEVDVGEAAAERAELTVTASGGGETATLQLELVPTAQAGGSVTLESDYPSLRGSTEDEFLFNLTLSNDTPQQQAFNLSASGPTGWDVTIQPAGEARAASVTVDARGTQRLEVRAVPPQDAESGTYPLLVEAAAGEHRASAELAVEITGTIALRLSGEDERLNTTANAGSTREYQVVLVNEGTSPLTAIRLSARGPSEWEIAFEPETVDALAPGASANAVARITPTGSAVAGDYVVTLTAETEGASEAIDVRVTVETSPIWGVVGVLLIAAALGGMVLVFRRYGRR